MKQTSAQSSISMHLLHDLTSSSSSSMTTCTGPTCNKTMQFLNTLPVPCDSRFVCTSMGPENICGSNGIRLTYFESGSSGRQGQTFSVCQVGKMFSKLLKFGDSLEVRLWFLPGAKYKVQCHFWCASNSSPIPGGPYLEGTNTVTATAALKVQGSLESALDLYKDTLVVLGQEVLDSSKSPWKIPLSADGTSLIFLNISGPIPGQGNVQGQVQGQASSIKLVQSLLDLKVSSDQCILTVFCPTMDGDGLCLDKGLLITKQKGIESEADIVCSAGKYYRRNSSQSDEAKVTFWYKQGGLQSATSVGQSFRLTCLLWCTKDGSLPPTKATVTGLVSATASAFWAFINKVSEYFKAFI